MTKFTTKDVEIINGRTIRKLLADGECTGYISGVKYDNSNLNQVQKHATLTEARNACGMKKPEIKITLPKSAYKQNQKGYDPRSNK